MINAPKSLFGQVFAYVVGGGGVTALHSGVYWLIAEPIRAEPYLANSLAAVVAGLAGYVLHSRFTFGHGRVAGMGARALGRFVVVSLFCYGLNSVWVWWVLKLGGHSVAASIIPMVLVTPCLGFVLNRYWTFRA